MQLGIDATRGESGPIARWAEAQAIVAGVASSAALGLGWAAREGPAAMVEHALGAMGVVAGTALLAVAPLWVFALHLGLELSAEALFGAVARAVRVTGIVLCGLSPTVGLVSISAERSLSVTLVGALALGLGGGLGLRTFSLELGHAVGSTPFAKTRSLQIVVFGFAALAAMRLAWELLPMLRRSLGGGA